MKKVEVRADGSKRVHTENNEPTRTQRQFQNQVNVNNIMAKYRKTGSLTHVRNRQEGTYEDLTSIPDLQGAYDQINRAEEAFQAMPSSLRNRFDNSPEKLIEFLSNPANDEQAIKLGLIKAKPQTPPPTEPAQ